MDEAAMERTRVAVNAALTQALDAGLPVVAVGTEDGVRGLFEYRKGFEPKLVKRMETANHG